MHPVILHATCSLLAILLPVAHLYGLPFQVVDLIEPNSGVLGVRGSSSGGFYVEDLSVTTCRDETDLQYVISKGLENRFNC